MVCIIMAKYPLMMSNICDLVTLIRTLLLVRQNTIQNKINVARIVRVNTTRVGNIVYHQIPLVLVEGALNNLVLVVVVVRGHTTSQLIQSLQFFRHMDHRLSLPTN
mgnify:CR=1 FL=1